MAKSLLTGSLPEDRGAGFAVIAARNVLKKWTETRVDQAVQSIDSVVEQWKDDYDVTGLQSALIDTIDVLLAMEWDQNAAAVVDDVPLDELVALAILKESEKRPHVATKGGAFLAVLTTGMLESVGELFDFKWLPDIQHGAKRRQLLAKANEEIYGNEEEKNERWRLECRAYDDGFKVTRQKTAAKKKAAKDRGVTIRQIERSLKKRREGKI